MCKKNMLTTPLIWVTGIKKTSLNVTEYLKKNSYSITQFWAL